MESKGRILDIARDWQSGKIRTLVELDEGKPEQAEKLMHKDLSVKLVTWRDKRSLDANAYYWALLSKLAASIGVSRPFAHNYLLRRYGQVDMAAGRVIEVLIPEDESARERIDEDMEIHLTPTDALEVAEDQTILRVYQKLKGSHEYNTKEMSDLLNGLISECKEVGIETATPEEIARMIALYEEARK